MKSLVKSLASFGLSVSILVLMAVVTFFGTIAQSRLTLLDTQRKYFESWFFVEDFFDPVMIPLPGGLTLMVALAINLLFGGIIRLKRTASRVGILITHVGVATLLLSGAVRYAYAEEGIVQLYPGQSSTIARSFNELEIVIEEADPGDGDEADGATRWVVPHTEFRHAEIGSGSDVTLRHPKLPFDLVVSNYMRNSKPTRAKSGVSMPVVNGVYLREAEPIGAKEEKQGFANKAGCYATVRPKGGGPQSSVILWDESFVKPVPATVEVDGRRFGVVLQKKELELPFEVRVDEFDMQFFPRTRKARKFESTLTVRSADGDSVTQRVRMNHPLRRDGVVLYQSSWGPPGGSPGDRLYTGLQTVRNNHADSWPAWSCFVIGIGMTIHFLLRFTRSMSRR